MHVVYEHCCGLDVHKKTVVACLITLNAQGQRQKEIRTFGTMTRDLLALLDWLRAAGCTHIALESTGVFCKPIFHLWEAEMTVLLVNAHHLKAVPGRKTDVKEAEWIADLLQHGLLRPSFIAPAPQREVRELTRSRSRLGADRTRISNRIHKVLADTNLKLTSVVTDVTGVSARAILRALLDGQTDPWERANLARGSLRGKQIQLAQALVGRVKEHHRFLLIHQLTLMDVRDEQITELDREIAARIGPTEQEPLREPAEEAPQQETSVLASPHSGASREKSAFAQASEPGLEGYAQALARLDLRPGINRRIAAIVWAEIGINMRFFPSAGHLASWAGMCPGSQVSAGKRWSGKTSKGSPWLRAALVEAAHAAARRKDTSLGEQ
jgi:transposase